MNCNTGNNEQKILHDGTSQAGRTPLALQPGYVQIEERSAAEWIIFARDYARFLQYYTVDNQPSGDWQVFWKNHPATVLAALAAAQPDWFRADTRLIFNALQSLDNQANLPLLRQHFNRLFDTVATLAMVLDEQITQLPDDLPIKATLRNLISTTLAPAFAKWIAWYKQAADLTPPFPLLDNGTNLLSTDIQNALIAGTPIAPFNTVLTRSFADEWITDGSADWSSFVAGIAPDATVFGSAPLVTTVEGHINFAIRHFFFTNVFEAFLEGFAKTTREARLALQSILHQWDQHAPHMTLFLAFLRLLEAEKQHINTITERHLRFYYNRTLRLKEKPATPSHAFLTIELAKNVAAHLLPKGTPFKAGKDLTGREIIFQSDEDFVPNKATVTDLRCLFKTPLNPLLYQSTPDQPAYQSTDKERYYAAPVVPSEDGLGADLLNSEKKWSIFGQKTLNAARQWDVKIPRATVGFALASHYLYLQEGTRTITLTFSGINNGNLNGTTFRVYLTTEKKWLELQATVAANQIVLTLDGDAPAIVPYSAKVHGGDFPTGFPVLKAELINETTADYAYDRLKYLSLTQIQLGVNVTGKRSLSLSSPVGPISTDKPFYPFGPAPESGAAFIIGDKEVFQKNANVTLSMTWKQTHVTPNFSDPTTRFATLVKGVWSSNTNIDILPHNNVQKTHAFTVDANEQIAPDFSPNKPFSTSDTAGFVRFELVGDYGHRRFPLEFAKFMANKTTIDPGNLQDDQIVAFQLNYTAQTTIPFQNTNAYTAQNGRFFHLHPFGYAEITPTGGNTRLLPLMVPQTNNGLVNNTDKDGGEWYIGVKDLAAPQVLSLLIQVAEGTANPLVEKPENHVQWAFLKGNSWVHFKPEEVRDGTNGLLQSGLVQLSIPREADTEHTILPAGVHWIRANVESTVEAVCQLIGVHAQGLAVTLADNQNDPQLSAQDLPAGTIAKLQVPDSAVKKVVQPYASFGGRGAETGAHFFNRVNERLRHKNRAITLWDYERLVLEAFPGVHKIKCLNHLRFEPAGNDYIYRELAPGHVTVIVISNVRQSNAANPLRPYTALSELRRIEAFLRQRMTCQATLHVRNPLFEPVKAIFNVRFYPGYDETFYLQLLNTELVRFMSPWAFDEGKEIGFGGKMYKSVLINFIEERPYVDYITDFRLIHQTTPPRPDQETIEPATQCSILVSADQHDITAILANATTTATENCDCQTA